MPAMPRTFGVYQSRGCRIREKRAELTVERVYVKSSTVIDSLPSSTLLWVDHEGWRVGGGQGEGVGRKGGGERRGGGLLVFRPSALGTPTVPRRALFIVCTLHLPGLSSRPEVIKHPTSAWPEVDGLGTGHFLSGQSVSPRDQ